MSRPAPHRPASPASKGALLGDPRAALADVTLQLLLDLLAGALRARCVPGHAAALAQLGLPGPATPARPVAPDAALAAAGAAIDEFKAELLAALAAVYRLPQGAGADADLTALKLHAAARRRKLDLAIKAALRGDAPADAARLALGANIRRRKLDLAIRTALLN